MSNQKNEFFPQRPESKPIIYAYSDPLYPGMLKVGYTTRTVEERMEEHYPTLRPRTAEPYKVELVESAMYCDGGSFQDHDVHRMLKKKGFKPILDKDDKKTEWFECSIDDIKASIVAVREHINNVENRTQTFNMRPEQKRAVDKTIAYYISAKKEQPEKAAKFLWNAKMRFGKTFTSYQLSKKMGFTKILILTFKPAVQSAWKDDLLQHVDFEGWQFICRPESINEPNIDEQYQKTDKSKPIVCFGSFQDFLGTNENGGIKAKNEWVHTTDWDLVIFDEYHFGAWRDSAKKLFENEDEESIYEEKLDADIVSETSNSIDETWLPISTKYYLYLSGTPFRALSNGEFIEEQIFSWTYTDEQEAKDNWNDADGENPYEALPRIVMLTYKIPDAIQSIAQGGEYDEFDLNEFFAAKGKDEDARFIHESYVQKWLDLIRGEYLPSSVDELKLGKSHPPMPYEEPRLLNVLTHTLWFLPNVASCYAMAHLLRENHNKFYNDYKINICAGTKAGIGVKALDPVLNSMGSPLETKTITLSCGKLTTGVTVKPWSGIFMLRNLKSPETYFQSAFRVQSPWEVHSEVSEPIIIKRECYIFDFALNRALKQISDYARNLDTDGGNPEQKVSEFIKFLPVIAYDGSTLRQVDAGEILDIAMSGTTATMLAKRWESALLVNVDNGTLEKLLANPEALDAVNKIVGFRALNKDIETIITKSEAIKKTRTEKEERLTSEEKKELTEEEKKIKSLRKQILEKLIKFATRIPVFMYLSDFREYCLRDVIQELEPELFKRVTGLTVKDFNLLVSLNVFNETLMNDAVYKFKRYEDASLSYTGIDKHAGEQIGLFSTVLSRDDYNTLSGTGERNAADNKPKYGL